MPERRNSTDRQVGLCFTAAAVGVDDQNERDQIVESVAIRTSAQLVARPTALGDGDHQTATP